MVKIQVNSQGKAYYTSAGKVLLAPEGGSTDKYKVGDRVTDDSDNPVGTVSSIFTDGNGDRYAVVCLDAVHRLASGNWCTNVSSVVPDLPIYYTDQWGPWESKETATYNTQKILNYCHAHGYTSAACSHCRSKVFTIDGKGYAGQLPNVIELNDIMRNHTAINTADPTASSYSSVDLSIGRYWWSSNQSYNSLVWEARDAGFISIGATTQLRGVIPVLEIPLED